MDRNRLCTVIVRQAIASIAIEVLQSFIRSLRTNPPYLHVFSINFVKEHGSQRAYACNDFKRRPMETPLTPLEFARRARKLYPDRVAVIDGTAPWTYAQFLDRCDRWSAALQKLGIKSGDRVAYLSPNTHAQLESFYAVPQIGGVLVPLNYRLTADDFVYLINHSGSCTVCADRDYLGTIDSIREQLPKVEPSAVFELMAAEQVTTLCAAPTVLISLANAPQNLRRLAPKGIHVVTAGAPPAANTIQRLEEDLGWIITHVYGLTETAPFITVCEPRAEHASLPISERAAIKARQGVELITSGELRVVDTEGNDVLQDGITQGEIVARGNVKMAGYYNDPEATEQALRGGWFQSGDAAVVHPDGYVEIRDRLKDVIISGGENISSVEVEGVLLRHPAVQEVAIVGFPHERWGEAPHAFG